jgi:hypothetical protein
MVVELWIKITTLLFFGQPKNFLFFNFFGLDFFHRFLTKFLTYHQLEKVLRQIKVTREMLKDQLHLCKIQFEKLIFQHFSSKFDVS